MAMFHWVKKVVPAYIVAADGSGDYTDIQAALDALPTGGGTVYVKEGTYTITAALSIPVSNVELRGTGRSTEIKTTGNITMLSASSKSALLIRDLLFTGAGSGANNYGVKFVTVTRSRISNCWFENCYQVAVHLGTNSNNNYVLDNYVTGSDGYAGINVDRSILNQVNGNQVTACLRGIEIDTDGNHNHITNNQATSCTRDGILISGGNNNLISSNICTDNDVDNTSTYNGIALNNGDDNRIEDNTCLDNDYYEISVMTATCERTIIIGNTVNGTDHDGTINDSGTNTQIGHNVTS